MTPPPMTTTEAWRGGWLRAWCALAESGRGVPGSRPFGPGSCCRATTGRDRAGRPGESPDCAGRAAGTRRTFHGYPPARYPLRGGNRGGSLDRTRHRQGGSSESGCWPTSASSDCAWACTVGELAVGGQRRRGFQDPPGAVGRRSRFAHSVDCATSQGDEESSANRGSASATHGRHALTDEKK